MSKFLRLFFALTAIAIPAALNFYYHPTLELSVIAGLLSLLLLAVATWSAMRFGTGAVAFLKVLAIAFVSSFMMIQALDALYILQAAPLGGRFAFLPELLVWAAVFASSAILLARSFSRPKK